MTSQIALNHKPSRISDSDNALIARYQTEAPVNVVGLAKALGINVYKDDLGPNVSGVLRRDTGLGGQSGYAILVHKSHHLNRQRFTVAHELGHFFLHRDLLKDELKEDEFYRALPGPQETDANKFAANLLMPFSLIETLTKTGVTGLEDLSAALGVSRQALAIRLGLVYDQNWE